MNVSNNAWFVHAKLKAARLNSEAESAAELIRQQQQEAFDLASEITRLEQRRNELKKQEGLANNMVVVEAKIDRLRGVADMLAPIEVELGILTAARETLTARQEATRKQSNIAIRFSEGAQSVVRHIAGHTPGPVIGGTR